LLHGASAAGTLRGLGALDGHGITVGWVVDSRHIIATSGVDEVGLTPGGLEGSRRGGGTARLGPCNLTVLLESHDLRCTRCKSERKSGALGRKCGSREDLSVWANLVPDVNSDGRRLSVREGVGVRVTAGRRHHQHIGAVRRTVVARAVIPRAS